MDVSKIAGSGELLAFRVEQFCAATGVSRSRFYGELKEGRLHAVRAGKRILVPRQAAEAWLNQLEAV